MRVGTLKLALLLAVLLGVLYLVLSSFGAGLALWRELEHLPTSIGIAIVVVIMLVVGLSALMLRRFTRVGVAREDRRKPVTREALEERLRNLDEEQLAPHAQALSRELEQLDQRAQSQRRFLALFGEVSSGKSALINTLFGSQLDSAVRAGTTLAVHTIERDWQGMKLSISDVPGFNEVSGEARAEMARAEALRCHVVLYVVSGDLTRTQWQEWEWLKSFGKPMLIALNKVDWYAQGERTELLRGLKARAQSPVFGCQAAHIEQVEIEHADGRRESRARPRPGDVMALAHALEDALSMGLEALEKSRSSAVVQALDLQLDTLEQRARDHKAQQLIDTGTRRAILAGMATVAPGSDLVLQSALAISMVKNLAEVYQVPIRELELNHLMTALSARVRTSSTLILAVGGNVLKVFPGLGTLGGGVLHAICYGMVVHSLGDVVRSELEQQRALDRDAILEKFGARLAQAEILQKLAPKLLDMVRGERKGARS